MRTNPKIFHKNNVYLKEIEVEFLEGMALIPIINCKSNPIKLMSGTIIGNFGVISSNYYAKCDSKINISYTHISENFVEFSDKSEVAFELLIRKLENNKIGLLSEKMG